MVGAWSDRAMSGKADLRGQMGVGPEWYSSDGSGQMTVAKVRSGSQGVLQDLRPRNS
jgi:hypothetical protein